MIFSIFIYLHNLCIYMVCVASCFSHVTLFVTLWTAACQAPLSIRFSRKEYWSRLPFPPPGDLSDPGIEPGSLMPPALAGRLFTLVPPGKPYIYMENIYVSLVRNWRRKWQPSPVFLPGEPQGWGSLVGCHLWGRRVVHDWNDLAAAAAAAAVRNIRDGNGKPVQYSCLENPMDGGAR